MSDENVQVEKDNFWIYIGAFLAGIIVLVVLFKSTHKEAIPEKAFQETQQQVEKQLKNAK
jgi:uncharacterized membrane protein